MSELPEGWARASLEELTGVGGFATDGDWIESKDQDPAGSVRLIQLMDIGDGEFRDRSTRFLRRETAERLNCTFLKPGDLLIARMPEPIGRACVFPDIGQDAVTAVDVLVWRPGNLAPEPNLIMHFVNSPIIRARIKSQAGGTTRQRVAGGRLKALQLPLPPSTEQKRIVGKLNSLLARTKIARGELERIPLLVDSYKKTILSAALSGDLTAGWRQERGLPDDRDLVSLVEVAEDFSYGSSSKSQKTGQIPVLRMGNIQDGRIDWDNLVYISNNEEIEKYLLDPGDVLFNRTNSPDLVGKTAMYPGGRKAIYAGYLIRVRCGDVLSPEYLTYCLNSPMGRDYCWRVKSDAVSQSNINAKKLGAFEFPLPSREEQDEIVRLIADAFEVVERFRVEHKRAAHLLQNLEQSLLDEAFRGQLVPQDPSDEPASVLLERIRAARLEESATRKRTRSRTQRATPTRETSKPSGRSSIAMKRTDVNEDHLSRALRELGGQADARELWQRSAMDIDEFYKLLREEIRAGRIKEGSQKERLALADAA